MTDLQRVEFIGPCYTQALKQFQEGELAACIEACSKGIAHCGILSDLFYLRSVASYRSGNLAGAMQDIESALAINPADSKLHSGRAAIREALCDYDGMKRDAEAAIALDRNNYEGYLNLAVLLATCPVDAVRDGARARQLAESAVALSRTDWRCHSALAAAHAELGDFPSAIAAAEESLRLAPPNEKPERERRLQQFQSGVPYRRGQ